MTYEACMSYLYERLPMFQRQGAPAFKKNLTNTRRLLEALDNPHKKLKTIHIAGTNGKGTSAHALASILQASGYKTGLYTSPHLKEFTERIKINGKPVSKTYVVDFVEVLQPVIEAVKPSFFELTVAMAFTFFNDEGTDIAVIETGLGGRLDSTNVVLPEVSLITRIGYDHMEFLGDTLEEIAGEKAGIIKEKIPVVIGNDQNDLFPVFNQKADQTCSEIIRDFKDYSIDQIDLGIEGRRITIKAPGQPKIEVQLDIMADYFLNNLPGVLSTIRVLQQKGWMIRQDHIVQGLENIKSNTGLRGRFQVLTKEPVVVADVSHNSDGLRALFRQVVSLKFNELHIIYGTVSDKDLRAVFPLFPSDASYYFTKSQVPRSMKKEELQSKALEAGYKGEVFSNVNEALAAAKDKAGKNDVILITGSTFVVAEINEL